MDTPRIHYISVSGNVKITSVFSPSLHTSLPSSPSSLSLVFFLNWTVVTEISTSSFGTWFLMSVGCLRPRPSVSCRSFTSGVLMSVFLDLRLSLVLLVPLSKRESRGSVLMSERLWN